MFLEHMNLEFAMMEHRERLRRVGNHRFVQEIARENHAGLPVLHSIVRWLLRVGGKLRRRRIIIPESAG